MSVEKADIDDEPSTTRRNALKKMAGVGAGATLATGASEEASAHPTAWANTFYECWDPWYDPWNDYNCIFMGWGYDSSGVSWEIGGQFDEDYYKIDSGEIGWGHCYKFGKSFYPWGVKVKIYGRICITHHGSCWYSVDLGAGFYIYKEDWGFNDSWRLDWIHPC